MQNGWLTYRKNRLLKGLLALAVLLSTFALVPPAGNATSQQKAPIELVSSFTGNFPAKAVAYGRVHSPVYSNSKTDAFKKHQANAVLNFNRHIIVQLLRNSKILLQFEKDAAIAPLKTIPGNSGEDHFISIAG